MIYDEREAYTYLAETVMDFVKDREFDRAMCRCDIYKTMVSSSCWLLYNNEIEKNHWIGQIQIYLLVRQLFF